MVNQWEIKCAKWWINGPIGLSLKLRNGESMDPLLCHFNCAMVNQRAHFGKWNRWSSFVLYVLNTGNGRKTFRMVLTTLAKSVPILSAVECKIVTNMSLSRQKRGDFDLKSTKNRRTRPDPTPPTVPPLLIQSESMVNQWAHWFSLIKCAKKAYQWWINGSIGLSPKLCIPSAIIKRTI